MYFDSFGLKKNLNLALNLTIRLFEIKNLKFGGEELYPPTVGARIMGGWSPPDN